MKDWLFRAALRLVPASWRESVRADIEEEARTQRRGGVWKAWQATRVAGKWRSSFGADALLFDLKYVVRSLAHAPGFTIAAMLTLVLGLGANIAVFTVVDRMLFRPLPFAHERRLVVVSPYSAEHKQRYSSFGKRLFVEGRLGVPAFEDMAYVGFTDGYWAGNDPQALLLTEASYNLLDVVGATPAAGRGFLREDAEQKRAVAMITYEAWQSRFQGLESAIGTTVRQQQGQRIIIGVLPPGFIAPAMNRSRRFDGLFLDPQLLDSAAPKEAVDPGVARLAPGASIAIAQTQFDVVAARLDPELGQPPTGRGPRVLVEPLRQGIFWQAHTYLWLVILAAGLVGLLACVNVSSLMLARGRSREGEIGLRTSLGASRGRVMLMEGLQGVLIAGGAALLSLAVLYWTAAAFRTLVPETRRQFVLGEVDRRVVLFAVAAALVTGVVMSVVPAWRASRASLVEVLHRGGAGAARSGRRRSGAAILTVEAAIGMVLVVGAAIVVRSFVGLATTELGFQAANLHVMRIGPPGDRQGGDNRAELARYLNILDEIRRQPGVIAAGAVDSMPSAGATPMSGLTLVSGDRVGLWEMTDGLLSTLNAQILAGRDITRAEVDAEQPVAVVTRSAATRFWPGEALRTIPGRVLSAARQPTRRVVGVVQDVLDRPDEAPRPKVFAAVLPEPAFWFLEYAVRIDPTQFNEEALRRELIARTPIKGVTVTPAGASAARALEQPRAQAVIFGSFAVIALFLAALGLFAVASFDVALRRPEMGLRMALGATKRDIRWLVIGGALRPAIIGVAIGLAVAYWLATFAQTLVYQTDVRSPWMLAAVAAVLVFSAILAAWLPAHRASRVDPAVVLRAQ